MYYTSNTAVHLVVVVVAVVVVMTVPSGSAYIDFPKRLYRYSNRFLLFLNTSVMPMDSSK